MLTPMLVLAPKRSNGRSSACADAIRDPGSLIDRVQVLAQHRELVPAEPGDRVGRSHGTAHPLGGLAQQLVARRVPEVVVDALEAVEIDEQDGDSLARLARALDGMAEPVGEEDAIGEAGERVAQRQLLEPLGGRAAAR